MPKSKKARQSSTHGDPKKGRKMTTFPKLSTSSGPLTTLNGQNNSKNGAGKKKNPGHQQQQHRRPIVPFGRRDRVLLIGEGDFSFARSLATQHRCRDILATCYDSKEALCSKYPQAEKNIQDILGAFPGKEKHNEKEEELEKEGEERQNKHTHDKRHGPDVLFSVDARKLGLSAGGGKDVRAGFTRRERKRPAWQESKLGPLSAARGGPWDIICFNFPHVGGLSTDVNRQVRANQELLVAFFKACVPLLSPRPEVVDEDEEEDWQFGDEDSDEESSEDDDQTGTGDGAEQRKSKFRTEPGQILVTLFEGEPYTLWNIRDLARHAGLRVVTSFKFPWTSYQGYSHARTLGEVEGKHGGRGGWRGEDREARTYVFEVKENDHSVSSKTAASGKKKKRPRGESDSDDSD